ncbi:hypothetical protein Nmel_014499 [Mimus melanotis]
MRRWGPGRGGPAPGGSFRPRLFLKARRERRVLQGDLLLLGTAPRPLPGRRSGQYRLDIPTEQRWKFGNHNFKMEKIDRGKSDGIS